MAKRSYAGVYANMEFPPYQFVEFPKHIITGPHGQYAVALNKAEEDAILNKLQKTADETPGDYAPHITDPAKEILMSRARELGVAFNSKWSKAKLQTVVDAAELEIDNLPADEGAKRPAKPAAKIIDPDDEPADTNTHDESSKEYKDALIAQAKSLGIQANHLWGVPRLKTVIAEAEANAE